MKNNMERLAFIGALNYGKPPICGETAKNQMLLGFFIRKYHDVIFFDTLKWRTSPILLLKIVKHLLFVRNRKLIISISPDSADILTRIFYYFPRKKGLYYFVIGGNIAKRMVCGKYNPKYYKKYDRIFVQGKIMVKQMWSVGLDNVEYLPNCRMFDKSLLLKKNLFCGSNSKIHFVFLSRIAKEKGVSLLLETIENLNGEGFQDLYDVTFYGPVADDFNSFFRGAISRIPNVEYKGFLNLQSDDGYRTLSTYDMMVFPTYWQGEGFPGVVVDAFVAGLPVLASDWNLNSEVIADNITGYLIKARDQQQLFNKMKYVLRNGNELVPMKNNCLEKARDFHSDIVLNGISL